MPHDRDLELFGILHHRFWEALQNNRFSSAIIYHPSVYPADGKYFLVCIDSGGEVVPGIEPVPVDITDDRELEIMQDFAEKSYQDQLEWMKEEAAIKRRSRNMRLFFLAFLYVVVTALLLRYYHLV